MPELKKKSSMHADAEEELLNLDSGKEEVTHQDERSIILWHSLAIVPMIYFYSEGQKNTNNEELYNNLALIFLTAELYLIYQDFWKADNIGISKFRGKPENRLRVQPIIDYSGRRTGVSINWKW